MLSRSIQLTSFQITMPPFALITCKQDLLGVMNPANSVVKAAHRAFDNLSRELKKSADDDNFIEEL